MRIFTKTNVESNLNWYKPVSKASRIESTLVNYYSTSLLHVIGSSKDPYKACEALFGSKLVTEVSEEVELSTVITYRKKDYKVTITSYIDTYKAGAAEEDYLYQIQVTEY